MSENKKEKDPIGKALGLQPVESMKKQIAAAVSAENDDINHARSNIRDLIHRGSSSLEDLLDVARASEHPRAYEVAAGFIKTLVDANKELADLRFRENKEQTQKNIDNRSINNYTFIGSTSDLLKMMRGTHEIEGEAEDE